MTPLAADEAPAGVLVLWAVICVLLLAYGVGHYRGWNKSGLLLCPFDSLHFMPAWFGAAATLVLLAQLALPITVWVSLVLFAAAVPPFAVTLIGLFWLPDRLLPAWYLSWRDHGRPTLEVASKADRKYYARRRNRRRP
ncbi:hypothetical protein [Nocardioides mangrovicus]|nr:hypothetical protein [Nocardioides mangrovicus]